MTKIDFEKIKFFEKKIKDFISSEKLLNKENCSGSSTISKILELANRDKINLETNKDLDFLIKKFEISGQLISNYNLIDNAQDRTPISNSVLDLFTSLVYLVLLIKIKKRSAKIILYKYVNVCLKLFFDRKLPNFLNIEKKNLLFIKDYLLGNNSNLASCQKYGSINTKHSADIKTLPINILFYEGPIARAYLEMLKSINCKPQKIIKLINIKNSRTNNFYKQSFIRLKYNEFIQKQRMHYWSRFFLLRYPNLCEKIFKTISDNYSIEPNILLNSYALRPLSKYSDEIIKIPFDNWGDSTKNNILRHNGSSFLYTGGGIVKKSFLDIPNIKIFHIHPGFLPDLRGADGLLWSTLLFKKFSGSFFLMNTKIDTGEIIYRSFLKKLLLPKDIFKLENKMIYRFIFVFLDPFLRATILKNCLLQTNFLRDIKFIKQDPGQGETMHFMSPILKNDAYNELKFY